jgi:branched-chain amino acid transport system ATP-binding protein
VTSRLECRDLECGYGAITVVRGFNVEAASGTVVAVLGPNGAGKTTVMNTMAGLLPRIGGASLVDGEPLRSGRPAAASHAGVVLVPDDRSLFFTLSVRENIEAARGKGSPPAKAMIDLFPTLETRWNVAAGACSGGEQQMLAVARALVQKPKVLLLDEMSMGLAPIIVEDLLPRVRQIADTTGAVVVLVEQHVQIALDIADEALVLVHGDTVLRGAARDLTADPDRLEAAYLGARTG